MRVAPPVELTEDQECALRQWARGRSLPARQVERARVVLLAAAGKQDLEIAAEMASAIRRRLAGGSGSLKLGLAGLEKDAPRPGRTPRHHARESEGGGAKDHARRTRQRDPVEHAHDGGGAGSARRACVASGTAHGLKPHLVAHV